MIILPNALVIEINCYDKFLEMLDSGEIVVADFDDFHGLYYKKNDEYIYESDEDGEWCYKVNDLKELFDSAMQKATKMYVNVGAKFGEPDEDSFEICIIYDEDHPIGHQFCVFEKYLLPNKDGSMRIGDFIDFPDYKIAYGFAYPLHQMRNKRLTDYVPDEVKNDGGTSTTKMYDEYERKNIPKE